MPETTCVVPNCSKKGTHRFPKDKQHKDAWIHAIKRAKSKFENWSPPSKFSYVCKQHFRADDYYGITYAGKYIDKVYYSRCCINRITADSDHG